jgi:hypothetical protein
MGLLDRIKQKRLDAMNDGKSLSQIREEKGLQDIKSMKKTNKKKGK